MGLQGLIKRINPEEFGLNMLSDNDLHSLQNALKLMVKDFDAACRKYGIEWSLSGGSILGAVRHNGFIPWDDDIDIFMTRKNFEKFRSIADKELGAGYVLKCPGRKNYLYHFPQLQKRNTEIRSVQTTEKANDGIFLDFFILENVPDNPVLWFLQGIICTLMLFIISSVRQKECRSHILKYVGRDRAIRNSVNIRAAIGTVFSFFPLERWLIIGNKCFGMCKNRHSHYVACPSGGLHYFKETFYRSKMCRYVKHQFDEYEWNIPAEYDYYLKKRYGKNYMQIPPENEREKHANVILDLYGNSRGSIL